ncbi:MAG: DUF3107 domain-containing protein [Acidimicrobiaceae bacterium]|nr:DUF3107 domain-containing protein [Acidimicrobiaceae bacterium]
MDIRLGISDSPKELVLEAPEGESQESIEKMVTEALSKSDSILWLTDKKGKRVGIPSSRIAYVEIGPAKEERRVGFGAL